MGHAAAMAHWAETHLVRDGRATSLSVRLPFYAGGRGSIACVYWGHCRGRLGLVLCAGNSNNYGWGSVECRGRTVVGCAWQGETVDGQDRGWDGVYGKES